jgi:TolA-binding protein
MKRMAGVLLGLFMAVSTVQAAEGEGFWGSLASKLHKLAPTRKSTATTAVGGVRGTKGEGDDIYWKGREKSVEIGEDELEKFNQAVESRGKGDTELALKQFDEFLRYFPKSTLRADAQQAVELIRAERAAAARQ